jgi:hypothetical protein
MGAGTQPWPQVPVGNKDHTSAAVVIIGAGISGMHSSLSSLTTFMLQILLHILTRFTSRDVHGNRSYKTQPMPQLHHRREELGNWWDMEVCHIPRSPYLADETY